MSANSYRHLVQVTEPRKTGRYRRATAIRPRPIKADDSLTLEDLGLVEPPKPPRESCLLILRDEEPTFEIGQPQNDRPDYGAVYRMIDFDRYPKPVREFFHEYGSDEDIAEINFGKLAKALRTHPAEVVAKALAAKCERIRKERQFNKIVEVEFK